MHACIQTVSVTTARTVCSPTAVAIRGHHLSPEKMEIPGVEHIMIPGLLGKELYHGPSHNITTKVKLGTTSKFREFMSPANNF